MATEASSRSPTLEELLTLAIEYHVKDIHVSLPGKVERYDAATQSADIKPLIKRLVSTEDGEEIAESLPVIPSVPVVFPRAGGAFLSLPVAVGDYCLLIFNSFPNDKYKSSGGEDLSPDDFGMHDLSDAVALMGFAPYSQAIAEVGESKLVLGYDNGGMQMRIDDQGSMVLAALNAATQAIALATKVEGELAAIQTAHNTHTHITTATVGPSPTPGVIAPTTITYTPGTVGSSKVTAEI